ncbi:enoyl-CoA hydratase/isomerase family protein [Muricoccus aerilatus]|uniref:enoyl-CoA hydratase/isomerase family protein n=1 Tax=Muricoccus aerilatus TaxID=452982 RepID=UPI000694DCFF|nr:enoyl-CoA hydratase/isomerase family protein [Roseomonas aerilata]
MEGIGEEVRLIRLRAEGRDFCRGRVSPTPPPGAPRPPLAPMRREVAEAPLRVYGALRGAAVPVLAVVRGSAHGYGAALVAASDLAVAADTARFAVPEMERGIPPLLVLTAFAGRVGEKAAAHLALGRREMDATEALAAGLVGEVVPEAGLEAAAERLTRAALDAPAAATRAVKAYLAATRSVPSGASALAANLIVSVLADR